MPELLLGIDIGTSACKVAAFKADGTVAAQATRSYQVFYPNPGWAEQDPEQWWVAVCEAIRDVLQQPQVDSKKIVGIGIDGQSWSAIALNGDGDVLCRTPIWMDTRSQGICDRLSRQIGSERIFSVCGNPMKPSYTLPKILWYKEQAPQIYGKIDKILQSNGYIVWKLTGEITQDVSQGYGLQCFDMRKKKWDSAMCREMGISVSMLPQLVACDCIVGRVTQEASRACGLPAGIPVVAGGLDAACGTLGAGVIDEGQTQEQGGQAGGMSICLSRYCADPRLILGYHVVPEKWLLQGGTTGGGGVMQWLSRELAEPEHQRARECGGSVFAEMDKLAAKIPAGSEGVLFLPYMAGERSPIWNPYAKGVFYGLDFTKTRAHFYRAAMEGVAYSLRHNLEIAAQAGAPVTQLHAMGGAANSKLWTQIKSDVTGLPIRSAKSDMATTLGAAMLAGVATGVYKDYAQAVQQTVNMERSYVPNEENSSVYERGFCDYLKLYSQLETLMHG